MIRTIIFIDRFCIVQQNLSIANQVKRLRSTYKPIARQLTMTKFTNIISSRRTTSKSIGSRPHPFMSIDDVVFITSTHHYTTIPNNCIGKTWVTAFCRVQRIIRIFTASSYWFSIFHWELFY